VTDLLSADDERILRLERGPIAGHTCKLIELDGERPPLTLADLRASVEQRLPAAPRLRRRLEPAGAHGRAAWVEDAGFDIAHHVVAARDAPLREVVAELMGGRLDRSRPLWSLHLARDALVWRIHHALADGTAAVRLASSVLWDGSGAPVAVQRPAAPAHHASLHAALARELAAGSGRTALDARVTSDRRVAFVGVGLDDLKRIEHRLGESSTVNDVVLCAIAGGLRRGLSDGAPLPPLRAKVPVSLHAPGDGDAVANRDSFVFVDLDVGEPDPVERLRAISRESSRRKAEHDAEALDRFLHACRATARAGTRWSMSPRVFALNVSNVRGPASELSVLGRRVTAVYSLAEVASHHALRIACLSAGGRLTFGLCADAAAVAGLDAIADGIAAELAELTDRCG
jgi:diacylglycerol O-acyltransferase